MVGLRSLIQLLYLAATFSYQSTAGLLKRNFLISTLQRQEDFPFLFNFGKGSSIPVLLANIEDYIPVAYKQNQLIMDSSFEWTDNKYEPGLFTFYMQEESLCPMNRNRTNMNGNGEINKRKFRSQIKMPAKYRINHRYNHFNSTITDRLGSKKHDEGQKMQHLTKIDHHQVKTQRLTVQNGLRQKLLATARSNLKEPIKSTNINKYFCYDINKQHSKMFIYKGQSSNFVKRLGKKFHKNPETNDRNSMTKYNRWIKTEYTVTEESINSDEKMIPKSKEKLNFLEFLIERNKQQRVVKSNSSRKTIEATLFKLTQFNHPIMLQMPQSLTIQQ